jgi:hypothetical protein
MKALVDERDEEKRANILNTIKPLLVDYEEIILDKLQNGSLLMIDIQHQINLVSGASFSNLLYYRMSSKDDEILKKKVE